ncbi:MAG: hypothetical protein V3U84_08065 [Thiotrichaceae bacterium]
MIAIRVDGLQDKFELHYLGYYADGFSSIEDAKDNAINFAKNVLSTMKNSLIKV